MQSLSPVPPPLLPADAGPKLRLLERVLESMAEGVSVATEDGIIIFTNPAEDRMFGYAPGELIGRHVSLQNAYAPGDNERIVGEVIDELKRSGRWTGEWWNRRKDGSTFYTHAQITSVDIDGRRCWICVQEDISDRKRALADIEALNRNLEQQVRDFETLLDVLPIGIGIAMDPECRDIRGNRALTELLGVSGGDNVSKSGADRLPFCVLRDGREVAPEDLPMQVAAREGRLVRAVELEIVREDGTVRTELAFAAPLTDGSGVRGCIGAFLDISERKAVERELRESELRFRNMADEAPVMIWMTEPDGHCVFLNRRWYEFTGQSEEQALGFGWLDAVHPQDRQMAERVFLASNARHEPFRIEYRFRRRDGVWRWAIDAASPRLAPGGAFLGYVGSVIDITERKQAEELLRRSEDQLRRLADSIAQLCWMAHPDGHIFWYNRRWYDYTGTTPDEMTGWGWKSVHDPEMLDRVVERWKASLVSGEPFEMEFPLRGADGRYRWFLTRALPVRDDNGRIERWFGTNTDIDELRHAREALLTMNSELEEFAYAASHDLQEPLRTVNVYTQLLVRDLDPHLDARSRQYAEYVRGAVRRMEQLIADLLGYSRTIHHDTGREPQFADLNASFAAALAGLEPRIREVEAEIRKGDLPVVLGDEGQYALVFQNLLSNSIKYRKLDAPLLIDVRAEKHERHWLITIRDTGIGFDQRYAERIFGLFKRLHRDAYPGTGLGLAIARRIVERYSGRIWAESSPGAGAAFFWSVPDAPDQ